MQPKQNLFDKQLLQAIALAAAVVGQGTLGAQIASSQELEGWTMWMGRAGGFDPRITDPAGDPAVYPTDGPETAHRVAAGFTDRRIIDPKGDLTDPVDLSVDQGVPSHVVRSALDPRITDPTGDLADPVDPSVNGRPSIPNRVVPSVLDPRITDPVGDLGNPGISVES